MRLAALTGTLSDRRGLALLAGLAVGCAGAALTASSLLDLAEQQYGLQWLFRSRGPVPPQDDVLVVGMNRVAADGLWLPTDPDRYARCDDLRTSPAPLTHRRLEAPRSARWPRCVHARLTDALVAAGAKIIVFDVLFRPLPPSVDGTAGSQDARLAASFAAARRVLVAQYFELAEPPRPGAGTDEACREDRPAELSPAIRESALGIAPMPFSATTFSGGGVRVDRFWTFKTCPVGWSSATLPTLALQAFTLDAYPRLLTLVRRFAPEDAELLPVDLDALRAQGHLDLVALSLRSIFRKHPALAAEIRQQLRVASPQDARGRNAVEALVDDYAGNEARFFNHFGPALTVPTINYDEALRLAEHAPERLANLVTGKAVFIGYTEYWQPEDVDHQPTVFTGPSGIRTSGVELIATAFANLLHRQDVRPASQFVRIAISFLVGLVAVALCVYFPAVWGLAGTALLAAITFALARYAFDTADAWLPLVVPLGVTAPAGVLFAAGWQYVGVVREKRRLAQGLGLFVPPHVLDQLVRKPTAVESVRESLDCSCLVTDAADFAALAETLGSEQLAALLNDYFHNLFRPVLDLGGYVSDVVGDSMLALWPDRGEGRAGRLRVFEACLDAAEAVMEFNNLSPVAKLPTRFGVHFGPVTLGLVGALTHYEYRAVGDAVNTAHRLQALNKRLQTRVLASEASIEGLQDLLLREVGVFRLAGRRTPLRVFEVVCRRRDATERDQRRVLAFEEALSAFQAGQLESARKRFGQLVNAFPDDGPSFFYAAVLRAGAPADGVIQA